MIKTFTKMKSALPENERSKDSFDYRNVTGISIKFANKIAELNKQIDQHLNDEESSSIEFLTTQIEKIVNSPLKESKPRNPQENIYQNIKRINEFFNIDFFEIIDQMYIYSLEEEKKNELNGATQKIKNLPNKIPKISVLDAPDVIFLDQAEIMLNNLKKETTEYLEDFYSKIILNFGAF